jgi:PPP family 3-phenylpropionic acid transporter
MSLRLFYVCYYTAVAISLPFLPPYFRSLGLTGRELSVMLSLAPCLHLGAPLLWGWLADRTRRPDLLLRIACGGAALLCAPLVLVRRLPGMIPVFAAHQLFAIAITSLADSLALDRVRRHGEDYGRIRLWGSISFVVACLALGPLFAARGPRGGDPLVPLLLAVLLGGACVAALFVKGGTTRERPHAADVRLLLRDRRFLFLLLVAPLHWGALAPYHGFFSILLQDRGLSAHVVGQAFVLSVLGEILAFYVFGHLRRRFSLAALFSASFAVTVVRWGLTAAVDAPALLVAVQALHALTFGLFWGTAVAWLGACVPPKLRATGQTLYGAATFGLGNLFGMLTTGVLYDAARSAVPAFWAAGAVELLPLGLTLLWGRRLEADAAPPRPHEIAAV